MALTATERALLIEARRLIANRDELFICWAIVRASQSSTLRRVVRARRRLLRYVENSLGEARTLEEWQQQKGFYGQNARYDRVAWIDWMLDQ